MGLDVVMDTDEEWAVKIRRMKFENHNQVASWTLNPSTRLDNPKLHILYLTPKPSTPHLRV
jgi:hypothetical protein